MPKATEQNITNRRAFLSRMAAGVAAGAAGLALAAVPALAVPVDPVFGALERFYKAHSELKEAQAAHSAAEREMEESGLFPCIVSLTPRALSGLKVPADELPADSFWPVMKSHADIDKFTPADLYPEDNKLEHEELSAAISRWDARMHPLQEATDDALDAERIAREGLVETVPTTMSGMMALLKWHRDLHV